MMLYGCSNVGSGDVLCARTDRPATEHAASLAVLAAAVQGPEVAAALKTGRDLIAIRDAGCGR
jgi:hypothetical protein